MTDPTLVEVTIRVSPSDLARLHYLVAEQAASCMQLAHDAQECDDIEASDAFVHDAHAWTLVADPLLAAARALRDRYAVAGTIDTGKDGK